VTNRKQLGAAAATLLGLALCWLPVPLLAQGVDLDDPLAGEEDVDDLFGDLDDELDFESEAESEDTGDLDDTLEDEAEADLEASEEELADDAFDEELAPDVADNLPSRGIEEILITATGREQPLQEAPISVAAFDEDYLQALGAQNIMDISQFTPNLEIRSPFSATSPTLFIRGVGLRDFNANSSSSVAVFNDDVYMNSPVGQLTQLFDVQSVEILRGPQGSLYGRNASAGAIRVTPRRPTGDFGAFSRVTLGRYKQREVEGALELPLVPDLLSARVSGVMNLRGGTTRNRCADQKFSSASADAFTNGVHNQCFQPNLPPFQLNNRLPKEAGGRGWVVGEAPPIDGRVNDVDNWALRGLIRVQPNEDWDWVFNVHGGGNRGDARQFQTRARGRSRDDVTLEPRIADVRGYTDLDANNGNLPRLGPSRSPEEGDPFTGDYNYVKNANVDLFGASANGDTYWGNIHFRNIIGYEWNKVQNAPDLDGGSRIGFEADARSTAWQVYLDSRALIDNGTGWTFLGGFTFLYEELDVNNTFPVFIPSLLTKQIYKQETVAYSFYGYGTYDLSDDFQIEAGARLNVDHRKFEIQSGIFSPYTPIPVPFDPEPAAKTDFVEASPTGDITLKYLPTEEISFYAKWSRGWKAPHINGLVIVRTDSDDAEDLIEPVDPETVNALEIGAKSIWWDSRLRVNFAAFHYNYDNIQVFQTRNTGTGLPLPTLVNAEDAELYGAELEVELHPLLGYVDPSIEDLVIFVSGALLQGTYNDFDNVRTSATPGQVANEDFTGNQLINAPKSSITGYAQWNFELDKFGTIAPRLDFAYKDRVYFSPSNHSELSQAGFWLLNARLAYTTPGGTVEVAGWVRNLTDEVYRADSIDLTRFQESILYAIGDPRTYGITATVRF
jgi:iron complex outermembrane receptor protein